jgi:simple sugar transport system permease protein
LSRRKLEKRNIPYILFFFGIGFGFIEYLNITDLFRQDIALFSSLSLIFVFILFQEFLANKEGINQWISEKKSIEIKKENKNIIQRYLSFLIIILILFSLMILIGEISLPIRFPIPPGLVQDALNIDILFFDLRNYGMLIGIIGLIVIIFGYLNLRKISLPSQLSDVYFLPYILISIATIFLFFSLAIFFKFNSFVSFTALIGSLIISTVGIIYYEWKNSTIKVSSTKSLKIMRYYMFFCIVLVIITFILSYFPLYIGSFFLPLINFTFLILIGLVIAFYEWFSWRRHPIPNPKKKDEDKAFYSIDQSLRYHLVFCTLLVVLSILIVFTGKSLIPMKFNLFFFRLSSIGSLFGILGLIVIIIGFLTTNRISKPKKQADIYYFPLFFKILSVVFTFLALNTFFEMDPFLLISLTLAIAAPIGFASLGGMFSEKSGVVNIGLEGMMLTGAFSAVWLTHETGDPWAGVIGAIIAGALMGLLHAVASIKYQANQVVVGVAINLLSSAVTTLGIWIIWQSPGQSDAVRSLPQVRMEFLTGIPIIGEFLYNLTYGAVGLSPLVYVFIAMIPISGWIIQRTTFGLRVRSVGEHPRAADTLGINVYRIRYICVIISGILAAVGGAQLTIGWISVFNKDMTNGRGFVALAALIFGGWHPIGAALASLFFGFAYSFRFQLESQLTQLGIDWIFLDLHLEDLTPTLPFIVTLIAVALIAKRMRPPAADGIPYVKEGG